MKKETYTLKVSLLPQYKNNLIELGFKKAKGIPRRVRSHFDDNLIIYRKSFDKECVGLRNCWGQANRYMEENLTKIFKNEARLETFSKLGYRYIGWYEIEELSDIERTTINIYLK